jgi:hypothetical protein
MMAGAAHPWGVMPPVRSSDVVLIYPAGYLADADADAATASGVTADDIQGVMISVAGTARMVSAGGNIPRALRLAVAVADSEMADDGNTRQ